MFPHSKLSGAWKDEDRDSKLSKTIGRVDKDLKSFRFELCRAKTGEDEIAHVIPKGFFNATNRAFYTEGGTTLYTFPTPISKGLTRLADGSLDDIFDGYELTWKSNQNCKKNKDKHFVVKINVLCAEDGKTASSTWGQKKTDINDSLGCEY